MRQKEKKSQATGSKLNLHYATQSIEEIYKELATAPEGLSEQEAQERKNTYGPNVLTTDVVTWWHILIKQISSPFIYVLVGIAAVEFFLHEFTDGCMILAIVIVNTIFSFYQEFKTQHALQLLKKYITDKITVIRSGSQQVIDAEDLVPGDIIVLSTGDRIPADIRFIQVNKIMLDESLLTGESNPTQKTAEALPEKPDLFNASNYGLSGCVVSSGSGKGVVVATGSQSYFGSLAQLAHETPQESSFALGIARFSKLILLIIFITITGVFFMHLLLNKQLSLVNLMVFSLALGISIIPEALPIVITFSLARGALHLAKFKLVIKRLSSIEDLGSMEVLCTDKTGTLTEGVLELKNIYGSDQSDVLFYGTLASGFTPAQLESDVGFNGPLWQQLSADNKKKLALYHVVAERPFDPALRSTSIMICHDDQCEHIIRGNVDETLPLCAGLTAEQQKEINDWALQESQNARRVLLIAAKKSTELERISSADEKDFTFIGLIAYEDPLKKTAAHALERAHDLGVQVKIISGDNAQVNYAIAHAINLIQDKNEIISGELFNQATTTQKKKIVEHISVFAHIIPKQKVEIIQLLEKKHDTGYMGDGINDAPALKVAHVSMAVNTAVDVTRDVADIILLKKSLHVINDGIYEGRVIFANIIKYIKSTLAANFGHFYALAIISLFTDFLPLLPAQLLLISLLTDFPLIAISTDTVSPADVKLPQKYNLSEIALITMLLGLIVMGADFIIFYFFSQQDPAVLQTNWFIASVLIELSFFYSIRTKLPFFKAPVPSWYVIGLSGIVACIALLIPYTILGQQFLHFSAPTTSHVLIIGAVVTGYFIVTDCVKLLFYRFY